MKKVQIPAHEDQVKVLLKWSTQQTNLNIPRGMQPNPESESRSYCWLTGYFNSSEGWIEQTVQETSFDKV